MSLSYKPSFEEYRLSQGKSPKTVYVEVHLIRELIAFLNNKYKKKIEPREILPADIREFLFSQKAERNLKNTTLKRKIYTIKQWYKYLWEINEIENDFMPKFRLLEELNKQLEPKEKIDPEYYEYLLSKKKDLLCSNHIRLYAKMLFILYLRGFRVRDIVQITLDDITDVNDKFIVQITKKNGYIQKAVFEDDEIPIFLSCIERAVFRGTSYLLSSKVDNEYIPLQLGSFKDYLISLKKFLGVPFRSEQIRLAYVHYLYTKQGLRVEDIQEILGLSFSSCSLTINEALERVTKKEYNKQENNY